MQQLMQQTVPIATAIATRDETGFEGSERCSTFADEISENRLHLSNSSELDCIRFALSLQCQTEETTFRQEIIDLLEQRTHSEGRGGENEHEFHELHE